MMKRLLHLILVLFVVQALYGAFVAGLRAGLGFNTFPLMDGRFMAEAATMMAPGWINLFENGAMVQFLHRWIGALLLLFVAFGWLHAMRSRTARTGWTILILAVVVQFLLGVTTLLLYVPVDIASLHQAGAVVVMLCLTYLLFTAKPDTRLPLT